MDKLLTSLPEVVRALAEPLSKVDKVTIVSTGNSNGTGLGASRLTTDIVNMVAQAPALFEALTGQKISDLMSHVPVMNGASENDAHVNGNNGATVEANLQADDKTR
jgi:flotillin